MSQNSHSSDQKAAFAGLLVTSAALFVICFAIVKWTDSLFAGHEKAAGTAAESTH